MSPVFSTPAGATVTYLSSTWPWSLHASSRNMTFWNDLLSALAQFSLFSSAVAPARLPDTHFLSTAPPPPSPLSTGAALHQALKSQGNERDSLKQSINQPAQRYDDLSSDFSGSGSVSASIMSDVKMLNMTSVPPSSINETLLIGASHYSNFTTDNVLNGMVDCSDFSEQKLLNIVICSLSDVNSNALENSTFNETLRNVSDDLIRLYNNSYYYNETDVTGNDTDDDSKATQFESTFYFIQVITVAVVLGIIILATVIGECFRTFQ